MTRKTILIVLGIACAGVARAERRLLRSSVVDDLQQQLGKVAARYRSQ